MAFFLIWSAPFALLLAVTAVATGAVTLSRPQGDDNATAMALIGAIVGGLMLLVTVFLLFTWYASL